MSHVIGRVGTYFANIGVSRLNSLSRYIGDDKAWKLENLTNVLLAQIPDEIETAQNLFIEGGFVESPVVKENDYLQMILDFSMQDDRHRNTRKNTADFKDTESSHDYQMQLYVTEYLLQSVM